MSTKLLTLALEDMYKQLNWGDNGITVVGEHLNHLRFACCIPVILNNKHQLEEMLTEINNKSMLKGFKVNKSIKQFMSIKIV